MFEGLSSEGKRRVRNWLRYGGTEARAFLLCCRVLPDKELRRLCEEGQVRVRKHPFTAAYTIRANGGVTRGAFYYCVGAVTRSGEHDWNWPVPHLDNVAGLYLTLKFQPTSAFHQKAIRTFL